MVTISKKVEYSIVFISYLAKNKDKTISLAEAARKLKLPYRFLGQLATALKNGDLVESREGKSGGYSLSKSWDKKTLYDLFEALGENRHMVKCLANDAVCVRETGCQLKSVWSRMEKIFIKELKLIKLVDL